MIENDAYKPRENICCDVYFFVAYWIFTFPWYCFTMWPLYFFFLKHNLIKFHYINQEPAVQSKYVISSVKQKCYINVKRKVPTMTFNHGLQCIIVIVSSPVSRQFQNISEESFKYTSASNLFTALNWSH